VPANVARSIAALAVVLAGTWGTAQAQRSVTIGWLGSGSPDAVRQQAFEQSVRSQGFAPKLEIRFAQARLERLPELCADLVRLKPDLILVSDAVSTAAIKKATRTIPIVMAGASDPVGLGLVQSLARPGGNITGLSSPFGGEFAGKWVELLRELRPEARRVALLWNPEIPAARQRHEQIRQAAKKSGVELVHLDVRHADDFPKAFEGYVRSNAAGLVVDNAPFITAHAAQVLAFARKERVATVWGQGPPVRSGGGLLSYGTDYVHIYRQAGIYAAKIMNGASPAELPVEQPTKYELVVNLRTAKSLGISVPPAVLVRADHVVQ
jgi:putative ABC transport system substrate-binding protein